jgi:hypothetical protein
MTLLIDATSPFWSTSATAVATSSSFTPPAGSLLVACGSGVCTSTGPIAATAITDSQSGSWLGLAGGAQGGPSFSPSCIIAFRDIGSSPVAMTVTCTTSISAGTPQGTGLLVLCFTGAETSNNQIPAGANSATNGVNVEVPLTTVYGGFVVCAGAIGSDETLTGLMPGTVGFNAHGTSPTYTVLATYTPSTQIGLVTMGYSKVPNTTAELGAHEVKGLQPPVVAVPIGIPWREGILTNDCDRPIIHVAPSNGDEPLL